ncbi:MAG: pyridoxal phosphate-dependent aminotransferase [Clostridia bacterium]|nr:pyridoxal phosphate-dependent aminotransferase [Clostridia bacterium]
MINEKMRALGAKRSVIRELFEYGKKRKAEIGEENVYDFSLGNPSVPSPEAVNESLVKLLNEENPVRLHGYTSAQGDATVRAAIADYINSTYGESITADCLYMSVGAAAALTSSLTAIVNPGEEVILPAPYFPEYKVFIERCGGAVKEVMCDEDLQLDVAAIEAAISEKTAAIIINSPNNPTGAVYSKENIAELADALRRCEEKYSHPIYLISDEPYRELVYDEIEVPYLTKYYDDTIVCYSYSKSLSIPGERIGYVLVCPRCADFTAIYQAVCGAGRALGFVCAPSLLQKLIPFCLGKTSDISIYDRNRRLLIDKLGEYGFEMIKPQGAFYLFIKSPSGDANEFCERAKKHEILIVPSDDFGCPGYARLAYCVTTEQIERALPAFAALAESYKETKK